MKIFAIACQKCVFFGRRLKSTDLTPAFARRAGKLRNGQTFPLTNGQLFTFHTDQTVVGDNTKASVSYEGICGSVKVGGKVLLDDGNISMEVIEVRENTVVCRVLNNGAVPIHACLML